ncbi:hypothetical protein, partial [Stenotrophomonas maltophilia]|uniref:hypothetical protein n=1 Tax=Stenotrophomonas maltophilia TaxID=40324 RepID=UPI0019549DD6
LGTLAFYMLESIRDLGRIQRNPRLARFETKTADEAGVVGLEADRGRSRSHTSEEKTVCREAQPPDSRMANAINLSQTGVVTPSALRSPDD